MVLMCFMSCVFGFTNVFLSLALVSHMRCFVFCSFLRNMMCVVCFGSAKLFYVVSICFTRVFSDYVLVLQTSILFVYVGFATLYFSFRFDFAALIYVFCVGFAKAYSVFISGFTTLSSVFCFVLVSGGLLVNG